MCTVTTPEILRASNGTVLREMISDLVARGVAVPVEYSTGGRGKAHRFHPTTAVGIVVAGRVMRSQRGCSPAYVVRVIAAFQSVTEDWLLARFAEGRSHLVTVRQGRPLLDGKAYDRADVREVYEALLATTRDD